MNILIKTFMRILIVFIGQMFGELDEEYKYCQFLIHAKIMHPDL